MTVQPMADCCVNKALALLEQHYQGSGTDWSIEASVLWDACDGINDLRMCIGCAALLARFAQLKGEEAA